MKLNFTVLPEEFAIVQLPAKEKIPNWISGKFYSLTQTRDELSIVCVQTIVPSQIKADRNWKVLKINENLDFSLVGVLADISNLLAKAGISIFVISTYNTDYLLVKKEKLIKAKETLVSAGHKMA